MARVVGAHGCSGGRPQHPRPAAAASPTPGRRVLVRVVVVVVARHAVVGVGYDLAARLAQHLQLPLLIVQRG